MADREGDLRALIDAAARRGTPADWLIRSKHDRQTTTGEKLWARLARSEPVGEVEFALPAAPDRPARRVRQTLYRQAVTLPAHHGQPAVTVTAILAREEQPPAGQPALVWRLLTNRTADTLDDVVQLIDFHVCGFSPRFSRAGTAFRRRALQVAVQSAARRFRRGFIPRQLNLPALAGKPLNFIKKSTTDVDADAEAGLLAGIGQRFLDFCKRFDGHFRCRTRTVEASARPYGRGLLQAATKSMERREEAIPEADQQALHHRLSESAWPERAVLDQVAQDANRLLGGHTDSALPIDESGCPKQGTRSVGVARQGCGQLGNVENGQVGVFAALSRGTEATWIDGRLFVPEAWTRDSARCQAAGIPKTQRGFQRKTDLALTMIVHARQQGIGLAWVGFDGFYGSDPAFLRALDAHGEVFVGDVHQDQRIYLDDPQPLALPAKTVHGRPPTRLRAQTPALRVDHRARQPPAPGGSPVAERLDNALSASRGKPANHSPTPGRRIPSFFMRA